MNDRQLRYILTIAEEQNLTAAARKLYISQPSLSNLLDHVERELGVTLFERYPSGMRLTTAGEAYVETARSILGRWTDLELQLSELRDERRGRLNVGCSTKKSGLLFPYIVPRMRELFPLYQFNMYEESMDRLRNMLTSGELDAAFLYRDYQIPGVLKEPMSREEICIRAPEAFESEDLETLTEGRYVMHEMKDLDGKPFVLFKKGRHLRKLADEIFQRGKFSPVIVLETDNWQTCLAMAERGEAFTVLPATSMEADVFLPYTRLRSKVIRPSQPLYRDLDIFYREGLAGTKVLQEFLCCCRAEQGQYRKL